jgi:hypothetical protein
MATSSVDNYGISMGALRGYASTAPSFVIKTHSNSVEGVEVFRIKYNNNVGILKSEPERTLDLGASTSVVRLGTWTGDSGTSSGYSGWGTNFYRDGSGFKYLNSHSSMGAGGVYTSWSTAGVSFNFFSHGGGGAVTKDASFTPTPILTVQNTQRIGINEPSPQDTLEVNGTALFKDAVKFTQDDGNEYIDSLADGYVDVGATTGIRLLQNTVVTGYVDASAGFKDNGTAGIDTTFLDNDGNTITVSGGIIVSKVAP